MGFDDLGGGPVCHAVSMGGEGGEGGRVVQVLCVWREQFNSYPGIAAFL